jgi:hypothetical protein
MEEFAADSIRKDQILESVRALMADGMSPRDPAFHARVQERTATMLSNNIEASEDNENLPATVALSSIIAGNLAVDRAFIASQLNTTEYTALDVETALQGPSAPAQATSNIDPRLRKSSSPTTGEYSYLFAFHDFRTNHLEAVAKVTETITPAAASTPPQHTNTNTAPDPHFQQRNAALQNHVQAVVKKNYTAASKIRDHWQSIDPHFVTTLINTTFDWLQSCSNSADSSVTTSTLPHLPPLPSRRATLTTSATPSSNTVIMSSTPNQSGKRDKDLHSSPENDSKPPAKRSRGDADGTPGGDGKGSGSARAGGYTGDGSGDNADGDVSEDDATKYADPVKWIKQNPPPNFPWGSAWKFRCNIPTCTTLRWNARSKADFHDHMNKYCVDPNRRTKADKRKGFVILDMDEKKEQ